MAGELPEGLMTNNENVTGEINRLNEVDVADVIRMWQVYAASRAVLPDNVGQRLANFLWRVWGSEKILQNLTGSQLAAHFSAISEDGPLRTTPTQSPRASRNLSLTTATYKSQPRLKPSPTSHDQQPPTVVLTGTGPSIPKSTTPLPRQELREDPLPSILKKPTTYTSPESTEGGTIVEDDGDESTPSATPRRNSPNTHANDRSASSTKDLPAARPSATRSDSEIFSPSSLESSSTLQSASSEDTIMPRAEAAPKARKPKPVFHASARKRPVAMKRKSSQSSSNATPSTTSPRPPKISVSVSHQIPTTTAGPNQPQEDLPHPLHPPASKPDTPQESWEDTSEATDSPPQTSTTQSHPRSSRRSSLVEPDFRSKFVEKTRSAQSSFVNLPSLLRKPSATTATSASQAQAQPQLAGRGRGKVTFTEGSKPPGPAGPDETGGEEGGEELGQVLPRTKSQLTLLLEKDRRAGGSGTGRKGS